MTTHLKWCTYNRESAYPSFSTKPQKINTNNVRTELSENF